MRAFEVTFAVISTVLATLTPYQAPFQTNDTLLQGTWAIVSVEVMGMSVDAPKGATLTMAGDRMTFLREGKKEEHKYKADASKNPKQIDLIPDNPKSDDQRTLGIYQIDGDVLKLCFAIPDKEGKSGKAQRPTVFDSTKGTATILSLKRAKE